ncbi:cytochrome P450 4A4-like [Haliotis cracherodii]|uniref:cytochrome P450 4A4-like n=1 Tax=Haliotis cracherodii TaxID=6455 RepID=UPI0039EAE131
MTVLLTLLATVAPVIIIVVVVAKLLTLYRQRRYLQIAFGDFTGPKPHWWHGNLEELRGDYEGMLRISRYANQYDGAFPVWVGVGDAFLMSVHPSTARTLLSGTDPKDEFSYALMRPWIGDGLLLSKGEKWARTRALVTPAFHTNLLKHSTDIFRDCTNILVRKLRASEGPQEMFHHTSLLTMDSMMRCLFGYETNCQLDRGRHPYIQGVYDVSELIVKRIMTPLHHNDIIYSLSQDGKRFKAACESIHEHSRRIVRHRRKLLETEDPGCRPMDFLDILMTSKDSDGQTLSRQEILDEVDTFMFAGHDSTSSALTWSLWHLAKHTQHQDTCRAEVDHVMGDREDITWDDVSKLEFLTMCVRESMRLLPPVPSISRYTQREITLPDGRVVPKGIRVTVSLFALHRNPDVWREPEVFDPYRFSNEDLGASDFFLTFSMGPRRCVGKSFAMLQVKLVIAMILRHFRLSITPGRPAQPESSLILRSKDGVYLNMENLRP